MQWTDESIAFLRGAAAMNRYYETVAERITPQLTENAHICDAGCGIGELSLAAMSRRWTPTSWPSKRWKLT